MLFTPSLALKVITGAKTVTRRLALDSDDCHQPRRSECYVQSVTRNDRCGRARKIYAVGQDYAVMAGYKPSLGRIMITGIAIEPSFNINHATPAMALEEGFDSVDAFQALWCKLGNPDQCSVYALRFYFFDDPRAADRKREFLKLNGVE